ncbi:MAG: hypothetical protein AB1414_19325 [bacterium]
MSDVELFDKWQEIMKRLDYYKNIRDYTSALIEEIQKEEVSLFSQLMALGLVS